MIDLHTHSTVSDGSLPPETLAQEGKAAGLDVMALTDHDRIDGVPAFLDAARAVGLLGVPGVELSAEVPAGQLHLVGLGFDPAAPGLREKFARLLGGRDARNRAMIGAFRAQGIDLSYAEVAAFAGSDLVSRVHFAQALVRRGLADDIQDAFSKYVGKGSCCYRERFRYAPEECIETIRAAGGIVAIAHPLSLEPDLARLEPKLADLRDLGASAMECYYSTYDAETTVGLLRIAKRLGLTPSVGSDFHGTPKPTIRLGRLPVPPETETALRALLRL